MTPERELLLKAMVEAGKPVKPSELAARVGKQSGAIRKMLLTLKESGQVEQVSYGYWQAVTLAGNSNTKAVTPVTLPGKGKGLSDSEKAAIAQAEYMQARNAKPENKKKKKDYQKAFFAKHPGKKKEYNKTYWAKKFDQAAKTKQGGNE